MKEEKENIFLPANNDNGNTAVANSSDSSSNTLNDSQSSEINQTRVSFFPSSIKPLDLSFRTRHVHFAH